jgi:hypothetical protein
VHASPGVKLSIVQIRVATGSRHPEDRQRPKGVQVGHDEGGLKVLCGIVHGLIDGAGPQHLAERVDGPVMIHDPAVRILLPHLLELATAHLVRLDPAAHRSPPGRSPYSRLASLISAWRAQSSRTTAASPVLKQIAGLPKLSQDELKALWREYFGVEPPAYRRGFLVRGLAHRIQELTYGGLKPAYQARLDAMIEGTGGGRATTFTCSRAPSCCASGAA